MRLRRLFALVFLLACVRLSDAGALRAPAPTHRRVEAQRPVEVEAMQVAEAEREHSSVSAQQAGWLQTEQTWPALQPFSWKFPELPVDPVVEPPDEFQPWRPVMTAHFALRCGESKIQVEVSQDLWGNGNLIKPEEITLGSCSASEVDDRAHVLIFEYELHNCDSKLVIEENGLIYAFVLFYRPKVSGRIPIVRSQSAEIGVECHYLKNNLSQPAKTHFSVI